MDIRDAILYIPDFPAKGILFRDLNPLWENRELFGKLIRDMRSMIEPWSPTHLVALEARGFIIASALAFDMHLGLSLIRKEGKLPGDVYHAKYENEYTFTGGVEVQRRAPLDGERILLVDDILATGKSSVSCVEVLKNFPGGNLVGAAYILELKELGGRELLKSHFLEIRSLIQE